MHRLAWGEGFKICYSKVSSFGGDLEEVTGRTIPNFQNNIYCHCEEVRRSKPVVSQLAERGDGFVPRHDTVVRLLWRTRSRLAISQAMGTGQLTLYPIPLSVRPPVLPSRTLRGQKIYFYRLFFILKIFLYFWKENHPNYTFEVFLSPKKAVRTCNTICAPADGRTLASIRHSSGCCTPYSSMMKTTYTQVRRYRGRIFSANAGFGWFS